MEDPRHAEIVGLDLEVVEFIKQFALSAREGEVFRLLLSGITTAEQMAVVLKISPHTVNNHLKSMFDKTGTPNKTELVSLFVRRLLAKLNHCKMFVKQPKVAIVDDEPDITAMIAQYLGERGVKTWPFTDPEQALAHVRESALDFVVSDIDMPRMNGLQLLTEIRRHHRVTPMMIFITGKPAYTVETTLDMGAVAFIEKPLSLSKLFFTLMEHFIEGTHERSRLLRVDTKVPTTINKAYKFTITNIGFGGAFLPFGPNAATAERRFKVGDTLDFSFNLEEGQAPIQAKGEIVWRRDRSELGLAAGIGVKFVSLDAEGQKKLEEYVRLHKIVSYIPLGRDPEDGVALAIEEED